MIRRRRILLVTGPALVLAVALLLWTLIAIGAREVALWTWEIAHG
ncbi:hypothetical protein [Rubellimicrobium aerolatum]|uniref:ABC transporter permease n=1 Tax=Rubellimicrobium aerolatum TaxID=490979 RepID=A0ABW0SF39_9RHOB|nr:hypothetical protein [Rubellimicrobium aerolatum]MBP1806493.1 hypothetical protein [Rubellimicrobium aerolatum]